MSTEANKVQSTVARITGNDNRRYVVLAQVVLALLIGMMLNNLLLLIWKSARLPSGGPPWQFFDGQLHLATALAVAITGAAYIYVMRNVAAQDFANEVLLELRKVNWPTWKETRQSTIVVIICVVIVSLILGGFDLIWSKLIKYLLTWGDAS